MRRTVTLDADVDELVRRSMSERRVSFRRAVNDAIRTALADGSENDLYRLDAFDMGTPSIPLTRALRVADDLEDAERMSRMRSLVARTSSSSPSERHPRRCSSE